MAKNTKTAKKALKVTKKQTLGSMRKNETTGRGKQMMQGASSKDVGKMVSSVQKKAQAKKNAAAQKNMSKSIKEAGPQKFDRTPARTAKAAKKYLKDVK